MPPAFDLAINGGTLVLPAGAVDIWLRSPVNRWMATKQSTRATASFCPVASIRTSTSACIKAVW